MCRQAIRAISYTCISNTRLDWIQKLNHFELVLLLGAGHTLGDSRPLHSVLCFMCIPEALCSLVSSFSHGLKCQGCSKAILNSPQDHPGIPRAWSVCLCPKARTLCFYDHCGGELWLSLGEHTAVSTMLVT